ncbi:MAG: carbohydrate porin, partial [Candidatus Methylumidiphilus sp.]
AQNVSDGIKNPVRLGLGFNVELQVDEDLGLFFKGMYSYTSTDQSISFGALLKGMRWGRENDTVGIGYALGWISKEPANYINAGALTVLLVMEG